MTRTRATLLFTVGLFWALVWWGWSLYHVVQTGTLTDPLRAGFGVVWPAAVVWLLFRHAWQLRKDLDVRPELAPVYSGVVIVGLVVPTMAAGLLAYRL